MGDASMLGELEHLVSPFVYSPETRLPDVDRSLLPRNKCLQGFISEDCKWGCFYNNATIQCFSVDTKISDYHYVPRTHVTLAIPTSPFSFPPQSVITCATELCIHKQRPWSGGVTRILVGLDCSSVAPPYNTGGGEGALAIYDQVQQQIVKWIPLPEQVTTIKVVAHYESSDSIRPFFNGAMMAMVGIAAVGMKGGRVLILDLGLDKTEFVPASGVVLFSSVAAPKQSKPFVITDVDPFERLIATNRHMAIRNNELISFSVGDPSNLASEDNFSYVRTNGSVAVNFEKEQVEVTAIDYVPNIGCLLIGFSFGGFQMWRVDDLTLQFSSELPDCSTAVLSFGFQQPIDDPKHFCYLWVLYGTQTYQMSRSKLDLHQLFFLEKPYIENFGYIYNKLHKCGINLTINLEDVYLPPNLNEGGEEGEEEDDLERCMVHPLRLWIRNELLFVSWKVTRTELFYVGVFDLNQWYSSHTAGRIPSGGLCPFWVAIPVEPSKCGGSLPWDFRLVPSTLQRWENQFKQVDIHFYPASVTFQGICLTTRGYYTFEHFGIQEKIIRLILKDGHSLLAEPGVLRQFCFSYGLQPFTSSVYEPELLSEKDIDRFYIFTAILESKRLSLIVKMANAWVDGSYTNVGCTIDLIIEWVRDLALSVRYLAEQHWDNVFNLTAERMLPETKKFLVYSNFVWNSLLSLLNILVRHDDVYNAQRNQMLDDLRFSLEKLVQYSAAFLMFYQADVLPTNTVVIESMADHQTRRRNVVSDALHKSEIIPEDLKKTCNRLVIDQMISVLGEDIVRKEWNLEEGEPLYPPRHAGYVVNMIMWRHVDLKLISRVIFYFLIDFMSAAGLPSSKLKGDFASVIHLNAEEQQEVYNLWQVDQGFFDETITHLAQNPKFNGRSPSSASWSVALTVLTAFKPVDEIADLLRMGCPPLLGKLYISVLGRHRQLYKKLLGDVCSSEIMLDSDVLQYFFKVALEMDFLLEFINTKLRDAPPALAEELISFLERHQSFEFQSLLLACYIKIEDIERGKKLYHIMKACWDNGAVLNTRQREIWARQQQIMATSEMTKKGNVIMDFLNMKKQQPAKPPVQVVAIKPKRIMKLTAHVRRAPSTPVEEMSPLRRYVPKSQTVVESPNDSLNGSLDEPCVVKTPDRRVMGVDVQSVLKTPVVDHRKSRRERREDSVNDSLYDTPPSGEDMHSILKKNDGSSRSKSLLKTRFIDPSSGKELASPNGASHADSFNMAVIMTPGGETDESPAALDVPFPREPVARQSSESSLDESLLVHIDSESSDTASAKVQPVRKGSNLSTAVWEEENLDELTPSKSPEKSGKEMGTRTRNELSRPSILLPPSTSSLEPRKVVEEKKTVIKVKHFKSITIRSTTLFEEEEEVPEKEEEKYESAITKPMITTAQTALHSSGAESLANFDSPSAEPGEPQEAEKSSPREGSQNKSDTSSYFSPKEGDMQVEEFDVTTIEETPAACKTKLMFEESNVEQREDVSHGEKSNIGDETGIEISTLESSNAADSSIDKDTSVAGQDESMFSVTNVSALDSSTEMFDVGPRRLTRSQKAMLESILEAQNSPGRAQRIDESLLTPKSTPLKEKSPARSVGRSRRGKSEEAPSIASSEEGASSRRRRSRRSETPESDTSVTSERRLTRSQSKKLETSSLDISVSPSSADSLSPEKKPKTRKSRGKTPVKSLMPIFEEGGVGEEKSQAEVPKPRAAARRRSAGPRAQSEPPASTPSVSSALRKRRQKVFDYAPELSTVMEVSDTSLAKTPTRRTSAKRQRSSVAEPVSEEEVEEASVLDASVESAPPAAGTSKRSRRSVTPSSSQGSDIAPSRRRRRASSVK